MTLISCEYPEVIELKDSFLFLDRFVNIEYFIEHSPLYKTEPRL